MRFQPALSVSVSGRVLASATCRLGHFERDLVGQLEVGLVEARERFARFGLLELGRDVRVALGGGLVEPGGAPIETLGEAHRQAKLGAGGQRLRGFDDQALVLLDQQVSRSDGAALAGEFEALDRLAAGVQLEARRRAFHLQVDGHRPGVGVLRRIDPQLDRLSGRHDVGGQSQSAGGGAGAAGGQEQGNTGEQEVASHRGPQGNGKVGVRKSWIRIRLAKVGAFPEIQRLGEKRRKRGGLVEIRTLAGQREGGEVAPGVGRAEDREAVGQEITFWHQLGG